MKSVKRFLSTILALTMLCSCMAVMNISAFAADDSVTIDFNELGLTSEDTYEEDAQIAESGSLTIKASSNGVKVYEDGDTICVRNYGTTQTEFKINSTTYKPRNSLQIITGEKGTISVSTKVNTGKQVVIYDVDGTTYTVDAYYDNTGSENVTYSLTTDDVEAGTYIFGGIGSNPYVYSVTFTPASAKIALDNDSLEIAPGSTATVTATIENDDTLSADDIVWTSSNENVTVTSPGATTTITVSESAADGDEATVTATLGTLTANVTVSVKSGAAKSVSSAIGAAGLMTNLSKGDSISEDEVFNSYFTSCGYSTSVNESGNITFLELLKSNNSTGVNTIKFTTTKTFDVVLSVASTSGSNTSTINIKDSNGEAVADATEVTGASATSVTYASLAAGTYYIYNPGTSRSTRLIEVSFNDPVTVDYELKTITVGDTVYYISGLDSEVTEDDVLAASECKLSGVNSETGSISYVYDGVEVSGTVYSADSFGYSYVYGFEVVSDAGTIDTSSLASTYVLSLVTE